MLRRHNKCASHTPVDANAAPTTVFPAKPQWTTHIRTSDNMRYVNFANSGLRADTIEIDGPTPRAGAACTGLWLTGDPAVDAP